MLSSSRKLKKYQPEKNLDNYVASIRNLNGIYPKSIPDSNFQGTNYLVSGGPDFITLTYTESKKIPIGFDIKINGKKYKNFTASLNGWIILHDINSINETAAQDILELTKGHITMPPALPGFVYDTPDLTANDTILDQFLNYDHILLAPWFDSSYPIYDGFESFKNGNLYDWTLNTPEKYQAVRMGADPGNYPFDNVDHGLRYTNVYDDKKGNCLLVRWTVSQEGFKNKLKFEIALYESGRIEYRYWPLIDTFVPSNYPQNFINSTATCGIFWSGANIGTNKFRDFSTLLSYKRDKRKILELGATTYDSGFSEAIPSPHGPNFLANKPYTHQLNEIYWPKNGAVITFSPPVNSAKFLTRKVIGDISSTREIVRQPGLFDDRKAFNFQKPGNGGRAHMPSTLPSRLNGDSGDVDISLRQQLFTSGSIQVTSSSFTNATIDGFLLALDAKEKLYLSVDRSFNEFERDYQPINSNSDFYATGSAIPGFTSPLKSKTQFNFSLPVTKKIDMPESQSAMYYYDSIKKTWAMVAPQDVADPQNWRSDMKYPGVRLYEITETSRGFDAVGRKIVSGSGKIGYPAGSLSKVGFISGEIGQVIAGNSKDDIGNIFSNLQEKTTIGYANSITDNQHYYPSSSQMISFPTDYPFLIEKIIVELPVEIGNNWFQDLTRFYRPYAHSLNKLLTGEQAGPLDFGGPGVTFSIMCARKISKDASYVDLIASGTITHEFDDISQPILRYPKKWYDLSPSGFRSFSNPTTVISSSIRPPDLSCYSGSIRLEMEASVSSGVMIAREDRSPSLQSIDHINSNRKRFIDVLTTEKLNLFDKSTFIQGNQVGDGYLPTDNPDYDDEIQIENYNARHPWFYLQQLSPLSRGSSNLEFNGNSSVGSSFVVPSTNVVKNPLYLSPSSSLDPSYKDIIDSPNFSGMIYNLLTNFTSKPSPYLIMPGDKITLSVSKTRPTIFQSEYIAGNIFTGEVYGNYQPWEDARHDFSLATGEINVTIYGSYIRGGIEYNP